jgi:hypothetical protein
MSASVQTYLRNQRISETLQRWPWLYTEVQKTRHRRKGFVRRIVTRNHAIMIEGFPRSGTSFAVQAMQSANPALVGRIATHLHTSAHLIRATQLAVPGMVLVREPAAAITSMIALGIQTGRLDLDTANNTEKAAVIAQATRRYAALHQTLLGLRDQLMIVRFEDATADFGAVIDAFNRRFGTTFGRFEHTPEATAEIFERSKKRKKVHLSPDAGRNEIKQTLSAHYAAPANVSNRQIAERVHAECLGAATRVAPRGERVGTP